MIVAVSGTDGAGKSTQIDLLVAHLGDRGRSARVMWHRPGYSAEAQLLKDLYRKLRPGAPPPGRSDARDALLAHGGAGRLWRIMAYMDCALQWGLKARWWSWTGAVVLVDRYLMDAELDLRHLFPANDVVRGLPWRLVRALCPEPALRVVLTVASEEAIRRCAGKHDPFPVPDDVRRQREQAYLALTSDERWTIVDATPPVEDVQRDLQALIEPLLGSSPNPTTGEAIP